MFARYYIEVAMPPEEVVDSLLQHPERWIPGLARHAHHVGDRLLAEVGMGERVRIARKVHLGDPVPMTTKTVIPLRWAAARGPGLFPSLDADLEVSPLGPSTTHLAISARYVPPLGALGRMVDRAILFRVAEATLKDFLDRVGQTLSSQRDREAGVALG